MKILSIYIENYGGISKTEYTFKDGVTCFCEKNGFGKTTIASFIKAMFYGLDGYRQNAKEFPERQHFCPFAGGNFGGNLTFEMGGDTYKIVRFFGEKSTLGDSLTLYKNGEECHIYGDELGKELFGIDRASFERTTFITSDELEISSTGSISAKINNVAEGIDDDINVEDIAKELKALRDTYKKSRKANDRISQESENIAQLTMQIANINNRETALPPKNEKYNRLLEKEQELTARQKIAKTAEVWGTYDVYLSNAKTAENNASQIVEKYNGSIPEEGDTVAIIKTVSEREKVLADIDRCKFEENDENDLATLKNKFSCGIPEGQQVENSLASIKNISALEAKISALLVEPTEKELKLERRFSIGVPSDEDLEKVSNRLENYRTAKSQYGDTPQYIVETTQVSQPKSKNKGAFVALASLGAVAFIVGIVLAVIGSLAVGISCIGGGVVLLGVSAFLYLNGKTAVAVPVTQQVENPEKFKKEKEMNDIESEIRAYLSSFGYACESGVEIAFSELRRDISDYLACISTRQQNEKLCAEYKNQLSSDSNKVDEFLNKYGYPLDNKFASVSSLQRDIARYNDLCTKKASLDAKLLSLKNSLAEHDNSISAYCEKYSLDGTYVHTNCQDILTDIKNNASFLRSAKDFYEQAENFKVQKNLTVRPEEVVEDVQEIESQLNALIHESKALLNEIKDDEEEIDKLGGLNAELEEANARKKSYEHKVDIIDATMRLLNLADKNLKDKYVAPIKDKFVSYSDVLEKTLGEKLTMTKDFSITYERAGKPMSEKYLSAGQRSLCALCLRLALIDNMYTDEKPFLILDDPFVDLDAEHMKKVASVLSSIAGDKQLIYFTCHESRNIK